jgi:hypothetical protein
MIPNQNHFLSSVNNSAGRYHVDCQLPKLDVAGSIPVSRSFVFFNLLCVTCLESLKWRVNWVLTG